MKRLSKGPARPIKDQVSRAIILAAMACVDGVVIFDSLTPALLIDALRPHVLVKGGDYDSDIEDQDDMRYIVGRQTVLESGGEVKVLPFLPGFSTTAIENKIIALNQSRNNG